MINLSRRMTIAAFALLLASACVAASAATYNVDVGTDGPDVDLGDGICASAMDGSGCTLRAAIQEANLSGGMDYINIPAGLHIVLTSNLPPIEDYLEILGPDDVSIDDLPQIDGADSYRLINANTASTTLLLRNLVLANGYRGFSVSGGGSAIYAGASVVVNVDSVHFSGNRSSAGGGAIRINGGAEVNISKSSFDSNASEAGVGGAVYVNNGADLLLSESSIIRSGSGELSSGEAVHVAAGGSLTVVNSMIDGADPVSGAQTGGILAISPAQLKIRNATLVNFTRDALNVDATGVAAGVVTVVNTIMAGADLNNCLIENYAAPSDITFSFNLIDGVYVGSGCEGLGGFGINTNVTNVDPMLGAAQGSPIVYRMPLSGSPVIDAGGSINPAANTSCATTDIRGTARPLDGDLDGNARCDIGAVEALAGNSVYVVNTSTDDVDINPGDDICETGAGNGVCTLRAAVMEANAKIGPDTIQFAPSIFSVNLQIPGNGGAEVGDLDITESVTIQGRLDSDGLPDIRIGQQAAEQRTFHIYGNGAVAMTQLQLSPVLGFGPLVPNSGGVVRIAGNAVVAMDRVQVRAGRSATGGGSVSVVDSAYLQLQESDFLSNRAAERGAALLVGPTAYAVVMRSSFWNNNITDPAVTEGAAAIHVDTGGQLEIRNSSVMFNTGGIHGDGAAYLQVWQSTIAANGQRGLFVEFIAGASLTLYGNIFAENEGGDCQFLYVGLADSIQSQYNLDQSGTSCSLGETNETGDPLLIIPGDSIPERPAGQITRVIRPDLPAVGGAQSPTLDVVPAYYCLNTDQLGHLRPYDLGSQDNNPGTCDRGAVEVAATAPTSPEPEIFSDGFE